ncbi:xylulokinase [Mucilaginibacter litoreus]|uniref:Xylulokinase n=1 Tax=Mucilaginibacter litoreus TaxID=1048221 RepID=A0ABW3ARV3_9SPHI
MLLLGIDIGTSSTKVSVIDALTQNILSSAQFPETEAPIKVLKPGWAEQSPDMWWDQAVNAIKICNGSKTYNPQDITAIGIAYQMHGLVMVDKDGNALRDSIIWCDSRAVDIGNEAFLAIGEERSLSHLLNSPGNFTASKLAWVKQNEPLLFERIYKIMLPGDYIAMKLTGDVTCSVSSLSEGIFYDFIADTFSENVINYYGFDKGMFPQVKPVFSEHGLLSTAIAAELGLKPGIPITYKAGDQPNNALSLNVLQPGEVAATAGTSGVIYGVSDELTFDSQSRVNTFAHVNYQNNQKRLGVLLCINGTGSLYRWIKSTYGSGLSYNQMNLEAATAPAGSEGLQILPFGNGAERMLNNKQPGAHILGIDLNLHTRAHILRAAQEGIACAFRYGLDIMRENGMSPSVIRAGQANLFLSDLFTQSFADYTGVPVELYQNDGSVGAAIGAGIGAGVYANSADAFLNIKPLRYVEPSGSGIEPFYQRWKQLLESILQETTK